MKNHHTIPKNFIRLLLITGIFLHGFFYARPVQAKDFRPSLSRILSALEASVEEISENSEGTDSSEAAAQETPAEALSPADFIGPIQQPTPSPSPTPTPLPTPTPSPTQVPAEIPQELQDFAGNYPETADFVAEYPEKYQLHPGIDLSEEAKSKEVPLFIQWDERWGYEAFGSSFIGCSGCGPTSFSMVAVYLTHDPKYSPIYMANYVDNHGYHIKGVGTSWNFFTRGCEDFGIHCTSLSVNEDKIKEYLNKGSPIICSVGPGDFTVRGHLIVITGYDKNGLKINDPNSRINSEKSWDFASIKSQIRSVWAFSAA